MIIVSIFTDADPLQDILAVIEKLRLKTAIKAIAAFSGGDMERNPGVEGEVYFVSM